MADTSGYLSTSSYNGRYLTFHWWVTGTSVENNQTTIHYQLYGDGAEYVEDGVAWYNTRSITLTIDGTVYNINGQDDPIELRSGTVVKEGDYTFTHMDDGTKAFGVNVEAGIYEWAVNCSGYTEWRLPDIARASQPSINTFPNNSPDFTLGDIITIHMNRKSTAFTHNVYFRWGGRYAVVATGVKDNCQYNTKGQYTAYDENGKQYTTTTYNEFLGSKTARDVQGDIKVDTYNGNTLIGSKTCPFVCHFGTLPPKINSVTVSDANGNVSYNGGKLSAIEGSSMISGPSKCRIQTSAGSDYQADITKIEVTLSGQYKTGADVNYTWFGDGKWTVKVTDSRGYTASKSGSFNVVNYRALSIDSAGIERDNADNTKALISLTGTWYNANLGGGANTLSVSVSGSESKTLNPTKSGNNYSVSKAALSNQYQTSSTYGFTITVKDKLQTVTRYVTLYEMLPVTAWFKEHFDVYGNLHVHKRSDEATLGVITPEKARGMMYSAECSGTIDDLINQRRGTAGGGGSINLTKKSSGAGSEIPAGWYNYLYIPHRYGSGGDSDNFGLVILLAMTGTAQGTWVVHYSYDSNGNRTEWIDNYGRLITFFDFSRLKSVKFGFGYLPDSAARSQNNGNDFFWIRLAMDSDYIFVLMEELFQNQLGYYTLNSDGSVRNLQFVANR